jgi:DNA-binding LacI/PurR family transcriptional regulator
MSSLRDVARRAGVSVATASRVATGSTPVRRETRVRVERAMRELLYVPPGKPAAADAIGLLVPELANPIFPALAQAMETKATSHGLASILCNTGGDPDTEAEYVHMLLERRVGGMVFISCEVTDLRGDHAHYRRLLAEGAKLVFVNGANEEFEVPAVGVDERASGYIATQHLVDLGHRRVGFVAGPEHVLSTREKAAGREAALRVAGLGDDGLVAHGSFTVGGGREALAALLERSEPPTGVICSSDLMAIGALLEAGQRGLQVPEDLSVVGFDGIDAASWTRPALTTIEQPIGDIADTAIGALLTMIKEPERALPAYVFRPKLRVGASTAPPRDR